MKLQEKNKRAAQRSVSIFHGKSSLELSHIADIKALMRTFNRNNLMLKKMESIAQKFGQSIINGYVTSDVFSSFSLVEKSLFVRLRKKIAEQHVYGKTSFTIFDAVQEPRRMAHQIWKNLKNNQGVNA